ncbi:ribbon-helix-helix protein, CopG family [Streptomyces sp. NBC_00208]|uniref:ribbon-helix-helix protein, CopG family n=1 Tax=Streptomyces sp. NBC_00208 TaxID=2975681 RepID=UPI003FA70FD9
MTRTHVRLHDPELAALRALSGDTDTTPNVIMRRAVREYVERHGVPIPPYADGAPCEAP